MPVTPSVIRLIAINEGCIYEFPLTPESLTTAGWIELADALRFAILLHKDTLFPTHDVTEGE